MLWLWLGFFAVVVTLLLLQRKTSRLQVGGAYWTAAWFLIGLSFVGLVYPMYEHGWLGATLAEPSDRPGTDASTMFVSAYLLEYALSFDTVIVISLQCQLYRIPRQHQPRVFFGGLVGAILVRLVIVTGAACLARAFTWTFYLFGALVAISALGALKPDGGKEMKATDSLSAVGQRKHMRLARILWRRGRLTDRDDSGKFWAMKEGRRVVTMAAACVLAIVLTEIVFAIDSSVAIMSVSKTTFIVVTSSILASIALRSWVSIVGTIENLHAPRKALAVLLGLISVKLLVQNRLCVPHAFLLMAIVGLIGAAVAEILLASRRARTR